MSDSSGPPAGFTLELGESAAADPALTGGKGANLARLVQAGFPVPDGFCVTTAAFERFMAGGDAEDLYRRLDEASGVMMASSDVSASRGEPRASDVGASRGEPRASDVGASRAETGSSAVAASRAETGTADLAAIRTGGEAVRAELNAWPVPADVEAAVRAALSRRDPATAWAVRSSATAEDLPTASFAGQQDTFLNMVGPEAVVAAVHRSWISLFTDRAIAYRATNGFSHRSVALSVVVQAMADAKSAGILFTADPLTGHRHIASIDAGPGLGEALVSGQSSADVVRVDRRTRTVIEVRTSDKSLAIRARAGGGTETQPLSPEERTRRTLSDADALRLAELGGRIEAFFGTPQDVEWVLDSAGGLHVVQSRPITTLFPVPEPAPEDGALHVYVSFGHAQMMTAAMPPLARSVWRALVPFGRPAPLQPNPVLKEAGGRLYLDPTPVLAIEELRRRVPRVLTVADELIAGAVGDVVAREEFLEGVERVRPQVPRLQFARFMLPLALRAMWQIWVADPAKAAPRLRAASDEAVRVARERMMMAPPGPAGIGVAVTVLEGLMAGAFKEMIPSVFGGAFARLLLLRLMPGEHEDVEAALRGLEGNVTTEMDLRVGDLADAVRADPGARWDGARLDLSGAGPALVALWDRFMAEYGDRGPSEIDVSAPRWREDPRFLGAVIAGRLGAPAGSHRAHHAELAEAAAAVIERLVGAARREPMGVVKAPVVRRLARAARGLLAVREHPKYFLVRVLGSFRDAVLVEADRLVASGMLGRRDDVWMLRIPELAGVAPFPDVGEIARRRDEFAVDRKRRPPRVITSDGETPEVRHRHEVPAGAMAGAGASAGVVEGVARVVLDPNSTVLERGEILVAHATDPGWTPLFLNAAGLVLEVGGLMTHGSVVAREYGIPAVVGVLDATDKIRTGSRVRVDGGAGYVLVLEGGGGPEHEGGGRPEQEGGGSPEQEGGGGREQLEEEPGHPPAVDNPDRFGIV